MEPPPHLRIVSLTDYRLGTALRVTPAILFLVLAVAVLVIAGMRRDEDADSGAVGLLCSLVCFGILAIVVVLPQAWRRLLGLAELRATNRDLLEARKLIDAGKPDVAADKLGATASHIAGKLHAYHAVVIASAAVAYVLSGQCVLGHGLLDHLERSGWLRAFSMRLFRDGIWASMATLRAFAGELPGAERALAACGETRQHADAVAIARVIVAARRGDADARARIALLLGSGAVATVRGRGTLLAIDGMLASAAGDQEADARIATELASLRPRLFAHARDGWPELAAWLERHGIGDATA